MSEQQGVSVEKRFQGCLLGLACGDSVGTTSEFQVAGSFPEVTGMVGGGKYSLLAGQFTDDTSMALCLAETLLATGSHDGMPLMSSFLRWYRQAHLSSNGRLFDIGNQTKAALEAFEAAGVDDQMKREKQWGNKEKYGNGSLMRLAPVVLARSSDPAAAIRAAVESSLCTHSAIIAADSVRYFAGLILGCLAGETKERLLSPLYVPPGVNVNYWKENPLVGEVNEIAMGSYKNKSPPEIYNHGSAHKTLEAAMWSFFSTNSFKEGVLKIANLGGDADTVAAVFGQLAGAYYGLDGIPQEWRDTLCFSPFFMLLATELLRMSVNANEGGSSKFQLSAETKACFELVTLAEAAYKEIYNKFSPGPGPPCVWPGGYKTIQEMDSHIDSAVVQRVRAKAAELGIADSAAGLSILSGYQKQLAQDREKMLEALQRRPALNNILAQIRKKT